MSKYIPIYIQSEILKRLPLKPLIQFRSVSKSWKRLIDSPGFMISYAVRHPQPDRFILRYKPSSHHYRSSKYAYSFFVDNDDNDNHHGFVEQDSGPTIPDLVMGSGYSSSVVGSSHGLVCFVCDYGYPSIYVSSDSDDSVDFDGEKVVVLWNPSIQKCVGIQVPKMYDSPNESYRIDDVIGFGVCPVTFDPTILIIKCIDSSQELKGDMRGISVPWKVRIFTVSTGTWSILSTNLPRESIGLHEESYQVVIDRFVYWLAYDYMLAAEDGRSQSPFLIMSFDLIAKEFKEINLTGSLTDRLCSIQTISKLQESLVLLESHSEFEEGQPVCLWMMKEQGVSASFTKLYTFNLRLPDTTINTLLGFRKTGALILETEQLWKYGVDIQIYEPNSEAIDYLEIDGAGHTFSMCYYRDSLLLVDQVDGFVYSISP